MEEQQISRMSRYRLFLSHASRDQWIARQMVRLIEEATGGRVEVFLDERSIEGGDSIPASIHRAINDCDELVVLLSPSSVDRPWVLIELGAAWGLSKRVVAIIDKLTPADLPDIIEHDKAIDLNAFDEYLAQLLRRTTDETP